MKALSPEHLRIHEEAFAAARSLERAEAQLIEKLIAVETELVFLKLGFASLFAYCREALKLSDAVSYNAITVARKARQVPELQAEIKSGAIGISTAKKIASVLTRDNQAQWLEKAKLLPARRLEKEVASVTPRAATPEVARYVSGDRLSLALGVSEELMLKLRRAQDQVSRSQGKAASLEETVAALAEFYLHRKDPIERAKRVIAKKGMQNPTQKIDSRFTRTAGERTPIPAATLHQVRLRDQDRCQFPKPGGGICAERRWLDHHHLIPVAQGGTHRLENIKTLCQAHHREVHREKNLAVR